MSFTEEIIYKKLKAFNLENVSCLFVTSDLGKIGLIPGKNKKDLLDCIYNSIIEINPDITIVVPTASLNLINNGEIFDINTTPSYKMGAFSEYIRKKEKSKRSYHSLWSLSAIGPLADYIVNKISNHAYDFQSAFANLFKLKNNFFLSLGNHPRFSLSIIHHFENMFNVPYRFTKTFLIHCKENNHILEKKFQLDVLKEEFRFEKKTRNKKIFENFENKKKLYVESFGKANIYYFSLDEFYDVTKKLFHEDKNCWLK